MNAEHHKGKKGIEWRRSPLRLWLRTRLPETRSRRRSRLRSRATESTEAMDPRRSTSGRGSCATRGSPLRQSVMNTTSHIFPIGRGARIAIAGRRSGDRAGGYAEHTLPAAALAFAWIMGNSPSCRMATRARAMAASRRKPTRLRRSSTLATTISSPCWSCRRACALRSGRMLLKAKAPEKSG